jgi:hypothetical protein
MVVQKSRLLSGSWNLNPGITEGLKGHTKLLVLKSITTVFYNSDLPTGTACTSTIATHLQFIAGNSPWHCNFFQFSLCPAIVERVAADGSRTTVSRLPVQEDTAACHAVYIKCGGCGAN